MKKTILFALFLIAASTMKAQFHWEPIDHQGNRTQTYPKVTEPNPEIQAMMNQVDTANIYNSIAWMQQFIREAYSPEAMLTQNWLIERYEELGLEPSIHYFIDRHNDTLDAGNVIAIQPGTLYPDEYIIVSSHYDHNSGPGADDNASGTAGVLEAARILSQYTFAFHHLHQFQCRREWTVWKYGICQRLRPSGYEYPRQFQSRHDWLVPTRT